MPNIDERQILYMPTPNHFMETMLMLKERI
uniref:Uncharacterized protein n=1 Tax=Romanomermis culicivorax TaxID=13658 RepID=A0A915KIP5_ROMCU